MKTFKIPSEFSSDLIQELRTFRTEQDRLKKDFSPSLLKLEGLSISLARHFGFCFGVQNAIEKIETIIAEHPSKRLFLISEIVHNPKVNEALKAKGVEFIQSTEGVQLIDWNEIKKENIVITPAFGTTTEINQILESKGIDPKAYDTTCPFVERVWNKGTQLTKDGATIVIHGKAAHEETRATFSRITGSKIVVETLAEAKVLAKFISGNIDSIEEWHIVFGTRTNQGFEFRKDLEQLAVINQTTMLASETQEIADLIRAASEVRNKSFLSSRDTLCYATNDNQTASQALMDKGFDLALVIGGEKSSNTNHLLELLETNGNAYFIRDEADLISADVINYFDIHQQKRLAQTNYFPSTPNPTIAITAGASCPDATIEKVIQKLLSIHSQNSDIQAALAHFKNQF
jgi:4-hydroxy-3-methylbut-2-enyl diphosphate reductase